MYQNELLDNPSFSSQNAFAYISNSEIRAQANTSMEEIQIYNLAGRLIIAYTKINSLTFSKPFEKAKGVYIAKIKLTNRSIVNQKVIHL